MTDYTEMYHYSSLQTKMKVDVAYDERVARYLLCSCTTTLWPHGPQCCYMTNTQLGSLERFEVQQEDLHVH